MRIVQLTPGTGNFYCGSCLRDHALVKALGRLGHQTLMVPLYLPLVLETDDATASGPPVFLGGINIYLQDKCSLFRHTPRWLDRWLDRPGLLTWASHRAAMTKARDLGDLTVSMLRGDQGRQIKELERLVQWLASEPLPDVVCLSNALLVGMARRIKEKLGVPIACTLHGEDSFLDALAQPHRDQAWQLLAERAADVDAFIAVSNYYGSVMRRRLGLPDQRVHVVHNGIEVDRFSAAPPIAGTPKVGYLARLCQAKGLHTLVDAFIQLKATGRFNDLELHVAGAMTRADRPYVDGLKERLSAAGVSDAVVIRPNLDPRDKPAFLGALTVFSVPATYGEAFGLYVIEALAAGVPVVQPKHGAFPELLEKTGGGILCEPDDPASLAQAIESLLLDRKRARHLAQQGQASVRRCFNVDTMARRIAEIYQGLGPAN